MQHLWSILCNGSSVDNESNRLSLFNIVEEIGIESISDELNIIPIELHIVSIWRLLSDEKPYRGEEKVILTSPEGETLLEASVVIDLTNFKRFRSRLFLFGFPLRGSGEYQFRITYLDLDSQEWIEVGTIPLQVNIKLVEQLQGTS